jgi:hypothetical protein
MVSRRALAPIGSLNQQSPLRSEDDVLMRWCSTSSVLLSLANAIAAFLGLLLCSVAASLSFRRELEFVPSVGKMEAIRFESIRDLQLWTVPIR